MLSLIFVGFRWSNFVHAVGHFESKYRFLYGYFSMYMKLVPGESAGVIATYYVSFLRMLMYVFLSGWFGVLDSSSALQVDAGWACHKSI